MHILVCISTHGFGHAAQTAPVINGLHRRMPDLKITVRTKVPYTLLRERIDAPFQYVCDAIDFGMEMASAVDVLAPESARRYWQLHRSWQSAVTQEAKCVEQMRPDLVLSNLPYLSIAGAAVVGIPSIALCSLNWADVFYHYCKHEPHAVTIYEQMLYAHQQAKLFLVPTPGMPMSTMTNTRHIGPIAQIGKKQRQAIAEKYGFSEKERWVLVAPGGLPWDISIQSLPSIANVRWVTQTTYATDRPDIIGIGELDLSFIDVLASSNVLLGKPGYGSVAECVCNAIPMIYVKREDWPEEPYLLQWLHRFGNALEISRTRLANGELGQVLELLDAQARKPALPPTGIAAAVDAIVSQIQL